MKVLLSENTEGMKINCFCKTIDGLADLKVLLDWYDATIEIMWRGNPEIDANGQLTKSDNIYKYQVGLCIKFPPTMSVIQPDSSDPRTIVECLLLMLTKDMCLELERNNIPIPENHKKYIVDLEKDQWFEYTHPDQLKEHIPALWEMHKTSINLWLYRRSK